MNRAEALRQIGELHTAWSLEHGDDVPYVKAHENPHDGQVTDLALWQADRSAPADLDDPLNAQIMEILAQIDDDPPPQKSQFEHDLEAALAIGDPQTRRSTVEHLVKHMPGRHDQSSHGHGAPPVRESLANAKTTAEVAAVTSGELRTILGRDVPVSFAGMEVGSAREFAEGVLHSSEVFPRNRLGEVRTYGGPDADDASYSGDPFFEAAGITHVGNWDENADVVRFNVVGGEPYMRATYDMARLTGSVAAPTPRGSAYHEMGHVVASHGPAAASSARKITTRVAVNDPSGPSLTEVLHAEIGSYAASGWDETVAEAFSDVMHNGDRASDLSHEIFGAIQLYYNSDPGAR